MTKLFKTSIVLITTCPICHREVEALRQADDAALERLIEVNVPNWQPDERLCAACYDLFHQAAVRQQTSDKIFHDGAYHILPTPMRVGANDKFTGRGITIAFLDSGFFPHDDLIKPHNRIKHYVNIANKNAPADEYCKPDISSWHGMMTSVVACGNGYLSKGNYRGIASEASVVLVKVGTASRIHHQDITQGLRWVIAHQKEFDISIVNLSCGGDFEASYLTDELSQVAEEAVKAGLIVVCAAGNSGHSRTHAVLPPASAPAVITVGGVNDHNTLEFDDNEPFHSSYGPTIDGLQKPEIIAPSIWLAAPILPGTPTAEEAELISLLQDAPDHQLRDLLREHQGINAGLDAASELPSYLLRQLINIQAHDTNIIDGNYKHVDGTSFAAPIVSSVIAQMLEANPVLTPQQVKRILIDTAIRLKKIQVNRQGWGMIIAGRAVEAAAGVAATN